MFRRTQNRPSSLACATASLAVVLVLVLTVLAASPDLHERLHGHATAAQHDGGPAGRQQFPDNDEGCVVTLYAQGIVLALAIVALALMGRVLRPAGYARFERVIPEAPRYLRLPTQAPPVGAI
jgi:hypothetical protein